MFSFSSRKKGGITFKAHYYSKIFRLSVFVMKRNRWFHKVENAPNFQIYVGRFCIIKS